MKLRAGKGRPHYQSLCRLLRGGVSVVHGERGKGVGSHLNYSVLAPWSRWVKVKIAGNGWA